jgi:hypothetical protein
MSWGLVLRAIFVSTMVLVFGQSAATAKAIHNTDIRNFDFNETDVNICNGHPIAWSGRFQVVDQFTANDRVTSFHTTTTFKGVQGEDLITGDTVHWVEAGEATDGFILGGDNFRDMSTLHLRWVSPGPGNDLLITAHFIYLIDANGILRVDQGEFEVSCV